MKNWSFLLAWISSDCLESFSPLSNDVTEGLIGSFNIDDRNGSENVSFKINFRFFNLCRVHSNLLKMASVGEFPWSWFPEDRTQV